MEIAKKTNIVEKSCVKLVRMDVMKLHLCVMFSIWQSFYYKNQYESLWICNDSQTVGICSVKSGTDILKIGTLCSSCYISPLDVNRSAALRTALQSKGHLSIWNKKCYWEISTLQTQVLLLSFPVFLFVIHKQNLVVKIQRNILQKPWSIKTKITVWLNGRTIYI